MPGSMCCDSANSISRLIDASADEKVKTTAYLTLEVLYASRRLSEFGDHIDTLIRHLLENPELPELQDMKGLGGSNTVSNQRIIAYIQATSQVVLNYASNEKDKSDYMKKQILRYVTLACNVLCEFLLIENQRICMAAFSAMRLILSHGLKPALFIQSGDAKKSKTDEIMELLNFDALTLSEEVKNMRKTGGGGVTKHTPQEKIVLHMCYLLTNRFAEV